MTIKSFHPNDESLGLLGSRKYANYVLTESFHNWFHSVHAYAVWMNATCVSFLDSLFYIIFLLVIYI